MAAPNATAPRLLQFVVGITAGVALALVATRLFGTAYGQAHTPDWALYGSLGAFLIAAVLLARAPRGA